VKLRHNVRAFAYLAGFSSVAALASACAAGEEVSSSRDSGISSRGGGFTGSGGSSGASGSGFVGQGGSNGFGGDNTSTGGSGGVTGQGGATGSGGSIFTGAGGSSGSSGSRFLGAGGAPDDSGAAGGFTDGPVSMGLAVSSTASTNMLGFTASITNNGTEMPPLEMLKIRYYFTDDGFALTDPMTANQAVNFDAPSWSTGSNLPPYYSMLSCKATLVAINPPKLGADHYFELGCSSGMQGLVLSPGDIEKIPFRLQVQFETPTDDYSFMPTDGGNSTVLNDHIVLLQGDSLAWGTPPP
jgi:hypothetical protein